MAPRHSRSKELRQPAPATIRKSMAREDRARLFLYDPDVHGDHALRDVGRPGGCRGEELADHGDHGQRGDPRDLLAGKVIGIGAAGLTQLLPMLLAGGLVFGLQKPIARAIGVDTSSLPDLDFGAVSMSSIGWFLVYFLLGSRSYAALYAALGSLVSRQEEVNQAISPMMTVMFARLFRGVLHDVDAGRALLEGAFDLPADCALRDDLAGDRRRSSRLGDGAQRRLAGRRRWSWRSCSRPGSTGSACLCTARSQAGKRCSAGTWRRLPDSDRATRVLSHLTVFCERLRLIAMRPEPRGNGRLL